MPRHSVCNILGYVVKFFTCLKYKLIPLKQNEVTLHMGFFSNFVDQRLKTLRMATISQLFMFFETLWVTENLQVQNEGLVCNTGKECGRKLLVHNILSRKFPWGSRKAEMHLSKRQPHHGALKFASYNEIHSLYLLKYLFKKQQKHTNRCRNYITHNAGDSIS